jgi:RNA polymerase sigma factor (sigma-70 family)
MPELDAQLLAELIERYGAALKLYARQWCVAPDDAVQQAFIDLAASRDCPAKPAAWLFTAVRNRAISTGRSERRRAQHEAAGAQQWFERRNDRHEAAEAATEVLQELPLTEREIVIAHLWGRLTFAEIAVLTKTSSSTAQRRYEAAISRMKEKLNASIKEETLPSIDVKSEI